MKTTLLTAVFITALLSWSTGTFSQTVFSIERFPNTYNTAGTLDADGSFTGNQGSWATVSSSIFDIEIDNTFSNSTPNALRFLVNSSSASATIGNNIATSPTLNLAFGACQPPSVALDFNLLVVDVENNNTDFTLGLQFFNGTTWATVWSATSDNLNDTYGQSNSTWRNVSVNVPNTYWNPSFRYRFYAIKNATSGQDNSTDLWIDDVQLSNVSTSTSLPNFSGSYTQTAGSVNGTFDVGDEFTFANVITSPGNIKAIVKVEAISNATLSMLDNNAAGFPERFEPRIAPNPAAMTTDQEGWVQFSITYRLASDNSLVNLGVGARFRHFDLDGSTRGTTGSFRETGWVTGQASTLVNTPSSLTDAGVIVDGGYSWRKILADPNEHNGLANDPEVYFTAVYPLTATVRFRMGYKFVKGDGGNLTPGDREYGSEFGCFNVSNNASLPVKLLSFSGTYKNQNTLLNWETENQVNFNHFEIERSSNGGTFASIGNKMAQANISSKQTYQFTDNLAQASGNVFYYRLKMVDADGQFKYSNVIMIRRDQANINGISINPNPIVNGIATVRLTASANGIVDLKVVDMSGRMVLHQQNKVFEGNNSLSIDNLSRLQPGVYTLQMVNGDATTVTTRFTIVR